MLLFWKKYKNLVLLFANGFVFLICVLFLYVSGYRSGSLKTQAHYQQILLQQAQEHQAKQSAWLKQAEQISQQQLAFQKQTEQQANELKKEIHNVMAKDRANGSHDCTFGEYSLQHYKKSLGYE
ncbi:hypothetical protein [Wielerella bovis]|uniref:hypothetical protein n=1 Tax=Wielerella bovis TaxID=2917790 RepID=UPI002019F0EB|nr:hypothetical protein [Wielerella bovis]MCG7655927.1 hypothetical protein [Wielerella bovis]MCG7656875.1 hypothetical protein [Wielerella bovis]MCG7658156.1 hypothetical protein [Wielerella bovis]MCG7659098.1 hypothetical protein [Wielerella bovis]MCG7660338.1 hypothetical protein [Wielerella bovis]